MTIGEFTHDDTSNEELSEREAVYGPLAAAVRELVDATIRTTVPDDDIRAAQSEIEAIVLRLQAEQLPGPAGVRYNSEARSWSWGNAAIGLRNAVAPPLMVVHEESGRAHADVTLGAAYEGPPGMVHGGVSALLLDHIMGETASAGFSRATFTGTLSIRYERGTPLGPLHLTAHIDREEGRKVFVLASINDSEGATVTAEGIFVTPAHRVIE